MSNVFMKKLLSCLVLGLALMVPVYAQTWHQVLEVKGSANKQTDLFEIKGSKWRIKWQKPKPEDRLSIFIYDKDGQPVDVIAAKESTADESYVHKPGKFYLSITATDTYTISIEDWR